MGVTEAEPVELADERPSAAGLAAPERGPVPMIGGTERPAAGPSVVLDGVHVSFPIYNSAGRSLRHHIMGASTGGRVGADSQQRVVVEALSDISFTLSHGDRVGLIGHNGAGKTTLLRVIAGIYAPWKGRVQVSGRVAPLFDVSLGIDMESTGYENIRLRGLYLGLTRAQIEARLGQIADFTDLGPFLHMPVRTYSAGMLARLAFSVSTSIEPEILLLDEGIAAGDAAFMEKANKRLHEFVEEAGILVFASHSDPLIRAFCNKALLLERGRIIRAGSVDEVLAGRG
ncbi:MAG: O-antigen/lipopolysaccharide transport ATP-binding protein ABC transporter RfbE [uncultured Microvirga sp.]|uniref:O-antigen/lipopolysaccharide transport ATP-binding protein ABC transporter RfbE n=1 Tax=uncultured Microvirga sp. TaxID=412392 RepID=A0A6J4L3G3_9HYPH|nr:MAG: O-antigen/lipopolysaccharide transport ATP-binding protein ABC transporter RfbE [uncultured Microvirga sp.]